MADVYMSTSDVVKFNDADLDIGIVSDVLNDAPLLASMAARAIPGYTYKYLKKTANPSVGFRDESDGRENTKATYSNVTVTLAILDASFQVDIATAEADERGASAMLAQQAVDHLQSAMFHAESEVITGAGAGGFNGLADQTVGHIGGAMNVNAGGTTADTGSSIYLVRSGLSDCHLVWGAEGSIDVGETSIIKAAGSGTGHFPAYWTPVTAWVGLQIGSAYSFGRICNVTEDSGKGATDDLISEALQKFPAGRGPTHIVMNRRSLGQLQRSRTATSPTGAPADFPDAVHGVPVIVTDAISSTEALLS